MSEHVFTLMRFNVLVAATQAPQPGRAFAEMGVDPAPAPPDAYAFAWDRLVYPSFHQGPAWHEPFRDFFRVDEDMVTALADRLDGLRKVSREPHYADLERDLQVTSPLSRWNRRILVDTCRYLYLQGLFADAFWKALVGARPTHADARMIVAPFRAAQEIRLF
jgi:hypothetical protein